MFPAHAGVIPSCSRRTKATAHVPRTRGGDPIWGDISKSIVLTVRPHGFCCNCEYIFTNEETGESFELCGCEANENGLTFAQPVRSGAIWFYKKKVG